MDSGCSKNMTERIKDFLSLKAYEGGSVTFGDEKRGYIIGIRKVENSLSQAIDGVHFMDGLKFSLLSVARISDKRNEVKFRSDKCIVTSLTYGEIILTEWWNKNIYSADLGSYNPRNMTCLSVKKMLLDCGIKD